MNNSFKNSFMGVLGFFAGLYTVAAISDLVNPKKKEQKEPKTAGEKKADEWEESIK